MLMTKIIGCMVLLPCSPQSHCILHIIKSTEIICGVTKQDWCFNTNVIFSDSGERQMLQSPCDLLLDFGSEVAFKDIVKRQLILTNHTGISAPFKLEAEYFTGYSLTPEQGICL